MHICSELGNIHGQFLKETYEMNKYNANFVTVLPSVIFLVTNFFMIYKFCHRYTRVGYTSFRAWFFRELTFHWSFFYLSKLWFIFMRMYKLTTGYICQNIVKKDTTVTFKHCHLTGLFLLSFLSMLPLIVFTIKKCSRTRIPNFLMWIGEDPWLRTEIGLAGHYLERPPRFSFPATMNLAYRTKRSVSIQERTWKGSYVRLSKSMGNVKDKSSKVQ